jgi:hypothetical protein
MDNDDWYSKHGAPAAPAPTPSDNQTDAQVGMNAAPITESAQSCTSCSATFWEHYAPGYVGSRYIGSNRFTGRKLGEITTISHYDNPTWTNIAYGTSSIVLTGDDNCRIITDADKGYEYRKEGGRSGGARNDGVYNYPMPTGNDNIRKATVVCASDSSQMDASLRGEVTNACTDCQVVFYQHYAPGKGPTGAILGTITMNEITTDLNNPRWVTLRNTGTSSAVMTGDSRCRFKSDRDRTYEYARSGSSGRGAPGVYNYPMPTGNDVMRKAYMWCADAAESRSDEA